MASVPDAVYPLTTYPVIICTTLNTSGVLGGATVTGSYANFANITGSTLIAAARIRISTNNATIPSGSMVAGEIIIFTGSGNCVLYVKAPSGSTNAIYLITGSYVNVSA